MNTQRLQERAPKREHGEPTREQHNAEHREQVRRRWCLFDRNGHLARGAHDHDLAIGHDMRKLGGLR